MNDKSQNELLSAYLDGELSAEESVRVEQLLVEDAAARQALDELRAVGASLKSLPTYKLDEDLSERVLRAAERQILAEPARSADAPRPAPSAKPSAASQLTRRLLSPRGLAWSGLAVSIAILFMVLQPEPPHSGSDIAKATDESTPSSAPAEVVVPEMVAAGKTAAEGVDKPDRMHYAKKKASPKGLKDDAIILQESQKSIPEGSTQQEALGRFTTRGRAGRHDIDVLGSEPARQSVPEQVRLGASRYERPTSKASPALATPAAPPSETMAGEQGVHSYKSPRGSQKGKASDEPTDAYGYGLRKDQGRSQSARRAGRSPDGTVIAGTAVRRAVQNRADVPVVECFVDFKAAQKDTFTTILAANDIEMVEVSPNDKPLAEKLVTDFALRANRANKQAGWYFADPTGEEKASAGYAPFKSGAPETLAKANRPKRARQAQSELAKEIRQSAEALTELQHRGEVKVVLVEGSEKQIATTLRQLVQSKDVSILPQTRGLLALSEGERLQATLERQGKERTLGEVGPAKVPGGRLAEAESNEEKLYRKTKQLAPSQAYFDREGKQRGRGQQRGTAQVLGFALAADQAPTPRSPSQPATPAAVPPTTAMAGQSVERQVDQPVVPQLVMPKEPAADRTTEGEKPKAGGLVGGMGGTGGMGGGIGDLDKQQAGSASMGLGLAGKGTQQPQSTTMPSGAEKKKPTTSAKPSSGVAKAGESPSSTGLDSVQQALRPADDEGRESLRQVLFVIRTAPARQPPAAATRPVDANIQQKPAAARSTESPD